MKKPVFYTEIAYAIGIIFIALGVVFATKANFGLSMIVLPAYVIHIFMSQSLGLTFFTFGMAEYSLQAVIIIVMMIVLRKFKISYFFSFVTAVIYGFILDGFILLIGTSVPNSIPLRILFFICGMLCCAIGVASVFRTYIPPEAYEMFVMEVSNHFNIDIHKFKTGYDIFNMSFGIILSLVFFGFVWPVGWGIGTIILTIINGYIISRFSKIYDRFEFKDKFPKFKALFK